jgi:hypothetical protein
MNSFGLMFEDDPERIPVGAAGSAEPEFGEQPGDGERRDAGR